MTEQLFDKAEFNEFEEILREAHKTVEDSLALEDKGYVRLGTATTWGGNILNDTERINTVLKSRVYSVKDPLCKQAVRLWTDYSFGTGMTWNAKDDKVRKFLTDFWDAPNNVTVLSTKGQRRSSDKLLIDGELFFAIFLGKGSVPSAIRLVDPLEITEIITNPEDIDDVRFYKREWYTPQKKMQTGYYRSIRNVGNTPTPDMLGKNITKTQEAFIYHMTINSIGQRGYPMLMPVLDWVKWYRQFLASRVAVMLAVAKFVWKVKTATGGQATVDTLKASYDDKNPAAGSTHVENASADLQPIKTDTGARNAYDDGRMLKLQVAAGTGWPEQYFGDISIGNLATAKTVELPVAKMCEGYQAIWMGSYKEINDFIMDQAKIEKGDKRFVDMDFPPISREDLTSMALALQQIATAFPDLADLRDVEQAALNSLGINNVDEILDQLMKQKEEDKKNKPPTPPVLPVPPQQNQQPTQGQDQEPPPSTEEEATTKLLQALKGFKEWIREHRH